MKVRVQFEGKAASQCTYSEAQQLLRMGLASIKKVFPLTLELKQYSPKGPDNDASVAIRNTSPVAPSESQHHILDCTI